jgi:transposase-like protein
MPTSLKSLAAKFREHQKNFYAAGGKPKAIKYSEEWRAAAARLRSEREIPVADLARALGVGHSALLRWCEAASGVKTRPQSKTSFVPVEIVNVEDDAVPVAASGATLRVGMREITVDIGAHADGAFVASVIAALAKTGRLPTC